MQSLWMVLAAAAFAAMGACVKASAQAGFGTMEIVLWRGLIGTVIMGAWAWRLGGPVGTPHVAVHVKRSLSGATALTAWFYAIAHLPLATAMTFNYTAPVWIAATLLVLSWRRGGARPDRWMLATIAVGFAGILVLLRPTVDVDAVAALVGVYAGTGAAMAYLQVRELGRLNEPEWRTVFWFSAMQVLFGVVGVLVLPGQSLRLPDAHGALLLAGVGGFATLGQIAMTRAFGRGRTLLTANLQYLGVVFSTLLGLLVFGEAVDATAVAGMAIVVLSGVASTWRGAVTAPAAAPAAGQAATRDASLRPPSPAAPAAPSPTTAPRSSRAPRR